MRKKAFEEGRQRAFELQRAGEERTDTAALVLGDIKTIYIPMPKAANSSIRKALLPTIGLDPDEIADIDIQPKTKSLTVPCSVALRSVDQDWFVFTVVRHPYDRAHSAWRDKLDQHPTPFKALKSMGLDQGDSFRTFLRVCNRWPRKLLNDHFIPQTDLLAAAMKLPNFRIYRMEELGETWSGICDEIEARGGVRPTDLPHLNTTRKPKTMRFPLMERFLMRRLYGRDFRPLGYR